MPETPEWDDAAVTETITNAKPPSGQFPRPGHGLAVRVWFGDRAAFGSGLFSDRRYADVALQSCKMRRLEKAEVVEVPLVHGITMSGDALVRELVGTDDESAAVGLLRAWYERTQS